MTLYVFKAQRTVADRPIEDLIISATAECPSSVLESLDAHRQRHDEQGRAIADALFTHLPGGTVDAVLRHMLEKRASLFVVPFMTEPSR